jgi:hypothetical protein
MAGAPAGKRYVVLAVSSSSNTPSVLIMWGVPQVVMLMMGACIMGTALQAFKLVTGVSTVT